MEKKLVEKSVLNQVYHRPITWKQIKDFKFEDEDIIEIGYVEPWENGPDNSGGGHYEINIIRKRLETDEEFEKRKKSIEKHQKEAMKYRYETYLKLKQEFEPENNKENDNSGKN